MLKLSDLKIDVKATVGSPLVLCRTNPTVEYAEGVRTSRRTGTRYTVACPAASMQTLTVKVLGQQTVECAEKGLVLVDLDDMEIYIYFKDDKPFVAARAKDIRLVDGQ